MRLYGKRFARSAIKKQVRSKQETRDAILWDVETSTNTCRVKIQNSAEYIIAHFPRNWTSTPYWMKPGNAVRVLHRGGNRGYVEVIGEGRAIPTPISGDSSGTTPDIGDLPDMVLSGCTVAAMGTEMGVIISSGTYRINGDIYTLSVDDQYRLFDSDDYALYDSELYLYFLPDVGGSIPMGVDAAPSTGSFRYDAFCVGIDGVIDYVKGTASSTPVKPDLPADHVLLGSYILVVGGADVIELTDIGRTWTTPYPSGIEVDIEESGISYDMPYVDGTGEVNAGIDFRVIDQYGNTYSGASCTATITQNAGGGSWSALSATFTGSGTVVTWTRDETDRNDDVPMVFTVSAVCNGRILASVGIINPEAAPAV